MSDIDERRDQYVPIDSMIAFKRTGEALLEKWGIEGLGAWMLLLAAAKREPVQGTFTYASDAEAWSKIGATPVGFTLDEFLTVLGRRKQTSRRAHGRLTYLSITNWGRWNALYKRRRDAAQKSRKRGESDADIEATEDGQARDKKAPEVEEESEGERPAARAPTRAREAHRLFECWKSTWESPTSILTIPRRKLVVTRMKEGFTEETMHNAILGSKLDDWEERQKPQYHTFDLILRDAKHIEMFAEIYAAQNGNAGKNIGEIGYEPKTGAEQAEHRRLRDIAVRTERENAHA